MIRFSMKETSHCTLLSLLLVALNLVAIVSAEKLHDLAAQKGPISQQQQQQQLKYHHSMSCYACSTMDYDNPADNSCRVMRQQHRLPSTSIHQSHQPNSDASYSTVSTVSQLDTSPLPSTDSDISTTTALSNVNGYSSHSGGDNATAQAHANHTFSNEQHHMSQALELRSPPNTFIRTRPCFEDENFCSIVSVVRIEFANDNLIARFWAMERNCSRSCNTGCMLIGERVRLRVCSQCCRTPNCNIGSGAASRYHHHIGMVFILPILLIALIAHTKQAKLLLG